MEPGVAIVSESLIKLQGVVSLVFLPLSSTSSTFSPKETSGETAGSGLLEQQLLIDTEPDRLWADLELG